MRIHLALPALLLASSLSAHADPVDWNTWSTATSGTIAAAGGDVGVAFTGPVGSLTFAFPSYNPDSTFADGVIVDNAPVAANNMRTLVGGSAAINTITFSTAVLNPVMAIWSLGQTGNPASFVFSDATPVLVSGGPNAEYGGSAITVTGNTINGVEGNGTVQFLGSYTSISWTNPQFESYYGFDVGIAGVVPEPAQYGMLLGGLALVGWMARRRR